VVSLHELQTRFRDAVLGNAPERMAGLVAADGIDPAERLAIHRNNSWVGFHATLAATYPVVERLAGEDWFRASARRYQRAHPSTSGDLQYVGQHYGDFLHAELGSTEHAYFADVAALEWRYQEALIAADSAAEGATFDPATLASVDPADHERLVFQPQPSLRLIESAYPLLAIWKAHQPGADPEAPPIRLDAGPSRVMLLRRTDHVELRELPAAEYALLEQFVLAKPLGAAAAAAAGTEGFDLGAALCQLVSLGTLATFHLASPP
jgi:hypothetical protein